MAYGKFNKVFGVVVWYNPSEQEGQTVGLYSHDVDRVIIVDNSSTDNSHLCTHTDNITYIPCMENKGIATALNIGCQEAVRCGAGWVLTMDQDSRWDQMTVRQYIEEVAQYEGFDNVAVFSPFHDTDGTPERHHRNGRFEPRDVVMCSGNLLRLSVWQQANGFRDDFFIDLVDDELCRHVHRMGWEVIRANHIFLTHRLGEGVKYLGMTKHPYTPHPAWRYYYIGRNMRYMAQLYPEAAKYYNFRARKELKRLLLYDFEDKRAKLSNYIRGLRDGSQLYPPELRWAVHLSPEYECWNDWMMQTIAHFGQQGKVIYDKRNEIRVFDAPDGSQIVIKRFKRPAFIKRLIYSYLRVPKAEQAYRNALAMKQANIPTPEAIGYVLNSSGLLDDSFLITRHAQLKHNFYELRYHDVSDYKDIIRAFAIMVADMHRANILHRDLSPGNILFDRLSDGTPVFSIIDINRMRIGKPIAKKEACRNFCRLWGHMDVIELLSREYAAARGWDERETLKLITKYWKQFWHIRNQADIDVLFDPEIGKELYA